MDNSCFVAVGVAVFLSLTFWRFRRSADSCFVVGTGGLESEVADACQSTCVVEVVICCWRWCQCIGRGTACPRLSSQNASVELGYC